jgi:hypothetical protein
MIQPISPRNSFHATINDRRTSRALPSLAALACVAVFAAPTSAQCPGWNTAVGSIGTDGGVTALAAFADPSGPALYVGGTYHTAGGLSSADLARWDGAQWSALPVTPAGANIDTMCVFDDGHGPALYVGGIFDFVGVMGTKDIARWDGTSWSSVGGGDESSGIVSSMCVYDDGSGPALYVGGSFDLMGGVHVHNLAKWDGSSWSDVGGGVTLGAQFTHVYALSVFDDGTGPALAVGGEFSRAGSVPAQNFAFWHGQTFGWTAPAVGIDGYALACAVYDDGGGPALFIGGNFAHAGGLSAGSLARYRNGTWDTMLGGVTNTSSFPPVSTLAVFDDGGGARLYIGGDFNQLGTVPAHDLARWDGSSYSNFSGGTDGVVRALSVFNDPNTGTVDLYVGGYFANVGGNPASHIAAWHGCVDPVNAYCFGDGTIAACPCANSGAAGHGCNNSAATGGAVLTASGTTYPDTMVLGTSGELPSALTVFLQGDQSINPVPFGDGLRCASGHLKRLYIKNASSGSATAPGAGETSITQRSLALGDPIPPALARYYQAYYRDPSVSFCQPPLGNTWNVTNAIRVLW